MPTLLLTFVLVSLAMLAMAVGVLLSGKALRGSCGGTGADCFCAANQLPRACKNRREHPEQHGSSAPPPGPLRVSSSAADPDGGETGDAIQV